MVGARIEIVLPQNMDSTWVDVPLLSSLSSTLSALKDTYDKLKAGAIGFPNEQLAVQGTEMYISGNMVVLTSDKPIDAVTSNGIKGDLKTGDPASVTSQGNGGIIIQTGASADENLTLNMPNVTASAIGVDSINLSTTSGATDAIERIKSAIGKVSLSRADMGAYQNRLEHTMNNTANYVENLTASESRIRDADMAKEMMEYTKNSILIQSTQAMLAQANSETQRILTVLK